MSGPGAEAFFPAYRPRASALHAARAGVGAAFCAALGLVFILFAHPLVFLAGLVAVVLAARRAGVGSELARAARLGAGVALVVLLINPLLSNEGATVLTRGWTVLGHRFDVTLEAVAFGAISGLRLLGLILACALFSAAVDPDDLLRVMRRVSPRSALTAALATRLVPVLARDASRRGEAARCRARPAPRLALARAAMAGSLERAVEVGAALELRGYSGPGAGADAGAPWRRGTAGDASFPYRRRSRHNVRVGATAVALIFAASAASALGVAAFSAYPGLELAIGAPEIVLAAVVVALAGAPFVGAGARLGVRGRSPGAEEGPRP